MAAFNLRRFSNPFHLKHIDPEHLTQLLHPYRGYFSSRGVALPALGEKLPRFDWDKVVGVFIAPDMQMPLELVETLFMIDELASPSGMDELLTAARAQGVDLSSSRSRTPQDIAVLAFVRDKEFAECVHQDHALMKKKGYVYFRACTFLPELATISQETIEGLRLELDDYYAALNRGRHCRIFAFPRDGKTWFVVRHGDAFKRDTNLEGGGVTFVYRPECFNTIFYDPAAGEIGVHACSDRERNLYRKLIGKHLFGFEETFVDGGKYTLDPLLKAGPSSLACSDIYGMEWIKLVEVHYVRDMVEQPKETRQAADLFSCYRNEVAPPGARLLGAKFRVKFRGDKNARRLSLNLPNEVRHARESDAGLTEQWLRARGFLRDRRLSHGRNVL